MTKEEVFETVKNVVVEELDVDEDQVTLDAKIKDDLEADSLDVFEIMNELEDKFDIEITMEEKTEENFQNVDTLVEMIKRLQ